MANDIADSLESSLSGTKKFLKKQTDALIESKGQALIDGEKRNGLRHPDEWKNDLLTSIRVIDGTKQQPAKKSR